MKKKIVWLDYFFVIYYILLLLGLILYDNVNSSPGTVKRIAYLMALIIPVLYKREFLPVVLLSIWSITKSSYSYPYVPTEPLIFLAIMMGFAIFNRQKISITPFFIVIVLHVFLNSFVLQGHLSKRLPFPLLEFFILFFCVEKSKLKFNATILPYVFIITSLAITYWFFFCENAKMEIVHHVANTDMETEGWMDPNYLSGIVGMGCVIAINGLINGFKNVLFIILCIITIVASLFTAAYAASRGGMIAIAMSALILFLMSGVKMRTKILVITSVVGFLIIMFKLGAFELLQARVEIGEGDMTNGRLDIWQRKLTSFVNEGNLFSWMFGFGEEGGGHLGHYSHLQGSHNDFIAILCNYGLLGLGLFITCLIYPIKKASPKMKPIIIAFVVYLGTVCFSLEPFSLGYMSYLAFYFYVIILSRYSCWVQKLEKLNTKNA